MRIYKAFKSQIRKTDYYGKSSKSQSVRKTNEIGGEIIMQKAVKVRDGDTPETLQKRIMRLAEWKILPAAAEKISDEIVRKKAEEK